MLIMDITGSSVADAATRLTARGIDDNYVATYYPDLYYSDQENTQRQVVVSPSVAVLGAMAFSDRVGQVFFAPAGLNRGGLSNFNIINVVDKLTYQDRNALYDARINPIAIFPVEGICVFGQKTLQAKPSALDRINVRRLLIYAKKTIASAAKYLLFEPSNKNTWDRFVRQVNSILDKIRQDQGIDRFLVVMDSTTNTPDLIDRNVMSGKIFLQPTRAAEFIDLSFIISSSGVAFAE
jgi:phage tail sheath protein FI